MPELAPGTAVVLFGLLSALTWGTGDFGGGMLARRAPLIAVLAVTQAVGIVSAGAVAIALHEPFPSLPDIGWAMAGGLAGMVGIGALYRGLAVGRMGVVSPISALIGAILPVVVGFIWQGLPPVIVIGGIGAALLAVVLVTRAPGAQADHPSGLNWALVAGLGVGGFNIFLGRLSGDTAFGPLVVLRVFQVLAWIVVIRLWRQPWRMQRGTVGRLLLVGILDMLGNAGYILAAATGQLAVAAVLSSLYPVTTVILAIVVLHERVTRSHAAGIALTAAAIALISAGSVGG